MTGVAVEADFDVAARALSRLSEDNIALIVHEIGALIEDQTKQRIADEKTAPDGTPWAPWSEGYAATRKPNHSLLLGQGLNNGLLETIDNYTSGLEAVVGTNLIYAAAHQFGSADGTLSARSYLGLSAENRAAIEELVVGWIEELLQ